MDSDRVELVRSLFVAIAERAEAFHEGAMEGQALHASHAIYTEAARCLLVSAEVICTLAKAAAILCEADGAETSE